MEGKKQRKGKKAAKKQVVQKCIEKGCTNQQHARGLCQKHLKICQRNVTEGRVTWERLESRGICLAPKPRGRKLSQFARKVLGK